MNYLFLQGITLYRSANTLRTYGGKCLQTSRIRWIHKCMKTSQLGSEAKQNIGCWCVRKEDDFLARWCKQMPTFPTLKGFTMCRQALQTPGTCSDTVSTFAFVAGIIMRNTLNIYNQLYWNPFTFQPNPFSKAFLSSLQILNLLRKHAIYFY